MLSSTSYRTAIRLRSACQRTHLLQQRVALINQLLRLRRVRWLVIELGLGQHRNHLARECVALGGDRDQLVLQVGVSGIVGIVAFDGLRGDFQAIEAELPDGCVDLLIDLGKLHQNLKITGHSLRESGRIQVFEEDAPGIGIIVLQANQRHDRRANVGMVGPGCAVHAHLVDARAHQAKPGGIDIGRHVPVIPGKFRPLRYAGSAAIGRARRLVVVGVAEGGEGWSAPRVARYHVQQIHLYRVGHVVRQRIGCVRDGIRGSQRSNGTFKAAHGGVGTLRVAVQVEVRRGVRVRIERRCHVLLCCEQACIVHIDLADLAVGAGRCHAVAVRGRRRAAHEVIALVGGEDEERIALVNAVLGEAGEELAESSIIRFERCDVASLAGAIRRGDGVVIMRVGDVGIGNRHAVFLHGRDIRERN